MKNVNIQSHVLTFYIFSLDDYVCNLSRQQQCSEVELRVPNVSAKIGCSQSTMTSEHQEDVQQIRREVIDLDKKFRKSCDQIMLLNNQIDELQIRYDR